MDLCLTSLQFSRARFYRLVGGVARQRGPKPRYDSSFLVTRPSFILNNHYAIWAQCLESLCQAVEMLKGKTSRDTLTAKQPTCGRGKVKKQGCPERVRYRHLVTALSQLGSVSFTLWLSAWLVGKTLDKPGQWWTRKDGACGSLKPA
jgi:hypothetical protein